MQNRRSFALSVAVWCAVLVAGSGGARALEHDTRMALRDALKRHLALRLTDGHYHIKDPVTSAWMLLRPKRIRPEVYGEGSAYLISAEFIGTDGKTVVVDFVLARKRAGFSVVKRFVGNRAALLKALRAAS